MNVRLHYMYRDAGNYKQHGSAVFAGEGVIDIAEAIARLRAACRDDGQFNAAQTALAELYFEDGVNDDDHSLHEFVSLEATSDAATDHRPFREFVETFVREGLRGWSIDGERLTSD
jgi:hypothetical protein